MNKITYSIWFLIDILPEVLLYCNYLIQKGVVGRSGDFYRPRQLPLPRFFFAKKNPKMPHRRIQRGNNILNFRVDYVPTCRCKIGEFLWGEML